MRTKRSSRIRALKISLASWWRLHAVHTVWVVCVSTFAFFSTLALGEIWARDDAEPTVHLLGSGSHLSLLITSEQSRLLIASGDDATAFSNALSSARHFTNRRIDVAILAGTDKDGPVARYVQKNVPVRQVFVIDGPLVAHLGDLDLDQRNVIARPTRIRLPGGIDVSIAVRSRADGTWSAIIRRGETLIRAGNSTQFDAVNISPATDIFTGTFDASTLAVIESRSIVLSSRAINLPDLREGGKTLTRSISVLRIEPGNSASLNFVPGALELEGKSVVVGGLPSS